MKLKGVSLLNRFKKITGNKLLTSVMKLMSATMIAQIISFSFSPILTRIYTPEEYGLLTLFTTYVAILISFATGRYEVAVVLPEKDKDSKALLYGSILYLSVMTIIIFLIITFFHNPILNIVENKSFSIWLYFVPVSIFLYGLYQNLNYWNNRYKNYNVIAFGRITETSSMNIIQLGLGLLNLGQKGLIFGYMVSHFFASLIFSIGGRKHLKETEKVSFEQIKRQLVKYKEYPLFNMPSGFFDIMSLQIPNLFISKYFGATSLGYYSLTLRIVNAPITFISTSVSQVCYQKLNEMYLKGQKLRPFILKAMGILSIISLIPFFVLVIWGPDIFSLIFGGKWRISGELARIMAFAVCVRLTVSPLSSVFFVVNRVKFLFFLQMSRLITTSVMLLIGSNFSFTTFFIIYSAHEVLFYLIYSLLILYVSNPKTKELDK